MAGDLSDAESLAAVPGFAPTFLKAVKEAGVRRIVFQSSGAVVDGTDEQPNPIAAFHADIERQIRDSGLEWTFLRLEVASAFRNQVFSVAVLLTMLQMMVLLGLSLYLPLFLQGVLAISPTVAGLAITPLSLSMVLGAMVAGPIIGALKRYQLVIVPGALLMGIGSFLLTLMGPETGLLQAIMSMILVGLGLGSFFSLSVIAQNVVPASRLGVSTAATRYLGQLGATLGIAIVGTVVSSSIAGNLLHHLPTTTAERGVLAGALQHGFMAALVFALIALVGAFFLKDVPFVSSSSRSVSAEELAGTSGGAKAADSKLHE